MDTDDESDNDSESVRDSDIEFMNEDESEEELSFYRRFENTVQPFIVLLFIVYRECCYHVNMSHIFLYILCTLIISLKFESTNVYSLSFSKGSSHSKQ